MVYLLIKMNQRCNPVLIMLRQRLIEAISHSRSKAKISHGQKRQHICKYSVQSQILCPQGIDKYCSGYKA